LFAKFWKKNICDWDFVPDAYWDNGNYLWFIYSSYMRARVMNINCKCHTLTTCNKIWYNFFCFVLAALDLRQGKQDTESDTNRHAKSDTKSHCTSKDWEKNKASQIEVKLGKIFHYKG